MTKYREILRLTALGLSQRNIIQSCSVSQKTIVKVQHRARELNLQWPLDAALTDEAFEKLMFPKASPAVRPKRMPDYEHILKELIRNGVNKKLLWMEYLEECRLSGDELSIPGVFKPPFRRHSTANPVWWIPPFRALDTEIPAK